jgi:hypothetical protein
MDFQTYLRQTFQQMDKDNISNKINSAILNSGDTNQRLMTDEKQLENLRTF